MSNGETCWGGSIPSFLVCIVVALLLIAGAGRNGWVPMDEGQLGQSAERVLGGELPHRDFDEPYSGGLAIYHAGLCRLLGVGSDVLALSVVPFFLVFVGCVFLLARRFVAPGMASGVGILCALMSLPLYPAPMPSWFNLFFSVYACLAVVLFFERGKRRYLLLTGACCGLSAVLKVTGIYTLGAAFLALVFLHGREAGSRPGTAAVIWQSRLEMAGALVFALLAVWHFSRSGPMAVNLWLFAMPLVIFVAAAIAAFFQNDAGGSGTVQQGESPSWQRRFPVGDHVLLAVGFLFGLLPLFGLYAWLGALPDLWNGLIVAPQKRLDAVRVDATWQYIVGSLPLALVMLSGLQSVRRVLREAVLLGGLLLLGILSVASALLPGGSGGAFKVLSWLAGGNMPVLSLAGVVALLWGEPSRRGSSVFAVLAFGVVAGWILYPFSFWGYVPYFSTFVVLGAIAVCSLQPLPAGKAAAVLAVSAAVLATLATSWQPLTALAGGTAFKRLDLPRSHTLVSKLDADALDQIVRLITAHVRADEPIFATPDAPQIYYLSQRKNPTRVFYEVLSAEPAPDPAVLRDRMGVRLVVTMGRPFCSPPPTKDYLSRLQAAFPYQTEIRIQTRPQEGPLYATVHANAPLPVGPVVWINPL